MRSVPSSGTGDIWSGRYGQTWISTPVHDAGSVPGPACGSPTGSDHAAADHRTRLARHTGELHAFNVTGTREILGTGELVGPGNYVYEPAGTVDTWGATSDGPCVIHLKATGAIEYLGPDGQVTEAVTAASQRAIYREWCQREGVAPDPRIVG